MFRYAQQILRVAQDDMANINRLCKTYLARQKTAEDLRAVQRFA